MNESIYYMITQTYILRFSTLFRISVLFFFFLIIEMLGELVKVNSYVTQL